MMEKEKGAIPSAAMENGVYHSLIHPAVADAELSEEDREISGIRACACVGIKYPYTEEGKPACLSRACPKNNSCKVCCKDWSKS